MNKNQYILNAIHKIQQKEINYVQLLREKIIHESKVHESKVDILKKMIPISEQNIKYQQAKIDLINQESPDIKSLFIQDYEPEYNFLITNLKMAKEDLIKLNEQLEELTKN